MHLVTSNFNLLATNSNWADIKKKNFQIDSDFDNFFFRINNRETYLKFKDLHLILHYESSKKKEIIRKIKLLRKYKKKNKIYIYFFLNKSKRDFLKEIENIEKKIQLNKNVNINFSFFNKNSKIRFNKRNKKYLSFPFELSTLREISKILVSKTRSNLFKPYKLIILDCDNTLWGGILDEEGKEKLKYSNRGEGSIFYRFQKFLKSLKEKGFILSISSKNEENKVWKAMKFKNMILQKKDFIMPKINWAEKQYNIKSILSSLSLRAEDAIFIDDSSIEVEKIKNSIKGINFIHFNKRDIFKKIFLDKRLDKKIILLEDKKKYYQYKLKSKFEEFKRESQHVENNPKFIKSLKQKIKFVDLSKKNINRTFQLFQKTNQFNFSLNRYNMPELLNILKDKNFSLKLINFKDKFGDHGLVGLFLLQKDEKKILIKDFLLSCRVLFRKIEDYMIFEISNRFNKAKIIIEYNQTSLNNRLVPIFLKNSYFKKIENKKNVKSYILKPNKILNETKKLFK